MTPLGWHWTAEAHGADPRRLGSEAAARDLVVALAGRLDLIVIAAPIARLTDVGAAAVALLRESHVAVHTDVAAKVAFVDVFSCVRFEPAGAVDVLRAAYGADRVDHRVVERG